MISHPTRERSPAGPAWSGGWAEPRSAERGHIVVVDDCEELLAVVRDLLEAEAYAVTTCARATDVLRCIRDARPDVIILDVRLPGADDWAVIERVRADPELRPIPTIVCSAATDQLRRREATLGEAGLRVVEKPFNVDELLGAVAALLPRQVA
jgi:CheY-like chemotaxis protein